MKRNIVLAAALVVLLGIGYGLDKFTVTDGPAAVLPISLGRMLEIKTPYLRLTGKGEEYVTASGRRADPAKVQEFLDILAGIRVVREIPTGRVDSKNRSEFFPNGMEKFAFRFASAGVEFLIGNKIDFSRSFYVEVASVFADGAKKVRQFVAEDVSPEPGIYRASIVHRSPAKYDRLKGLLYLKEEAFALPDPAGGKK